VRAELEAYGQGLADKPELVALNKADALTPEVAAERKDALTAACGKTVRVISGVSGSRVRDLLRAAWNQVRKARGLATPEEGEEGWAP
jgi:GTP-binding protein